LWSDSQGYTKTNARLRFVSQQRYGLKVKFSPDSVLLCATGGDGTARLYKCEDDFKLYRELKIDKFWMWDVAFSNDSKYLFVASSDGTARLWKIETKNIEREYLGHSKALTAIAFRDEFVKPGN
jgi:G protein beta subunit-like protein